MIESKEQAFGVIANNLSNNKTAIELVKIMFTWGISPGDVLDLHKVICRFNEKDKEDQPD